ncbi:LTA synthase family protein [Clostridium uliginosum]|uniref:Phosphoglycerol transferase MdoB n=1 Tax=Clostridium uliginosum TaxID=119641 RepID=A0A1I1SUM9_9CLOT|nr:LTA synthase family protein [Clostridium uliginosum]SFD47613.1 Phosphoglycerol transferase MdoB [Clostridium uliginosum]
MDKTSFKSYFKKIYTSLIEAKNKLLTTQIRKLRLSIVIAMLIKTILFLTLLQVTTADEIKIGNIQFKFALVYLAFILLLYSFGYLFSKNKQIIFYIILNISYSILLIADLWYFRVNRDFFGIKNILFKGTFNPIGSSLFNFKLIDIIFIIDVFLIIVWIVKRNIKNPHEKNIKDFLFTLTSSILIILISFICLDVLKLGKFGTSIVSSQWTTLMSAEAPGPLGYDVVQASKTLSKAINKVSDEDKQKIEKWIDYNKEDIQPNKYSGLFQGKNVIFLQIESLENFVINQKANDKEISPFLNKLSREGLYFNNIYEQNNAGNSIDCDLMVNTSIYPLGDKITALNYGENVYSNSLPRILEQEGYTTISTHAELPGEFNWSELHKNGFGVQSLWSINDYTYEETVGYGLSDRSFLTQISEKVKDLKKPFFLQAPTLSSHGPFNIDQKYRELNLPDEIDKSYLGGYFESVHYTDKQLEMFFNQLESSGLLNNTVLVIYGDHTGVHKYYNDSIKDLDYEGNWWKEYDHKIPLIIYSKDVTPSIVEAHGGQVDILPTISYLLGLNDNLYKDTSMGRILVNTNRNATIIKGNNIVGEVNSSEEKDHLLNAYDIGDKIIKNNYFNNP